MAIADDGGVIAGTHRSVRGEAAGVLVSLSCKWHQQLSLLPRNEQMAQLDSHSAANTMSDPSLILSGFKL